MFNQTERSSVASKVRSNWKAIAIGGRKDFSLSGVTFGGLQRDYPALMDHVSNRFRGKGIGLLLGPVNEMPVLPAPYNVPLVAPAGLLVPVETFMSEQNLFKMKIDDKIQKTNSQYELGLTLIQSCLSGKPLGAAQTIMRKQADPWKDRFIELVTWLRTTYTNRVDVIILELTNSLDQAPMAINVAEALIYVNLIFNVDMDLTFFDPTQELSDSAKRYYVLKHLCPLAFAAFINDMQAKPNSPAWTFAQISDQLDAMEETDRVLCMSGPNSSVSASPDVAHDPGAAAPMVNSTASSDQRNNNSCCNNCGDPNHFRRDCDQLCKCNNQHQRKHHPSDCDSLQSRQRRGGYSNRPSPQQQSRGQSDSRGQSHFRGQSDSRGQSDFRGQSQFRGQSDSRGQSDFRSSRNQSRGPPPGDRRPNLYDSLTKKRGHVNEVYAHLSEEQDYEDDEEEFDYRPDHASVSMVTVAATHSVEALSRMAMASPPVSLWFKLQRQAVAKLLQRVGLPCLNRVCQHKAGMVTALAATRNTPRHLNIVVDGYRVQVTETVSVTLKVHQDWVKSRECDTSLPWANRVWHAPFMVQERVAVHQQRRDHWKNGRRRRACSSALVVIPSPRSGDCVPRSRPVRGERSPRRPYLALCKHYRSSVRGRGRDYRAPWWLNVDSPLVCSPVASFTVVPPCVSHPVVTPQDPINPSVEDDQQGLRLVRGDCCPSASRPLAPPGRVVSVPTPGATLDVPSLWALLRVVHQQVSTVCTWAPAQCFHINAYSPAAMSLAVGMLDTGANLPITNPLLADMVGVTPCDWPEPIPITFGNNTDCVSTQFVELGSLIGKMALVDSAQTTILTKHALHRQHVSIFFRADRTCQLLDEHQQVVYESHLKREEDFFMIPLMALLPGHLRANLAKYLSTTASSVNGRHARPPVTAAEVSDVMALHERMYHPSGAVMARALRSGAWLGVDIEPTTVERVFAHQDCLYCALGKMKRNPRPVGSSLMPPFGQDISIDYLPVTTVARGGYTGAYVMTERSQAYAWAYLVSKPSNSTLVFKAISHVRSCLRRYGFVLKAVRTDAGRVENAHALAVKLAEVGIVLNAAAPEAQYQNPVERFIQTAARGIATTLLSQRFLDNTFWGMALLAWVRGWNCRPNAISGEFSPEFALTGHHPDVSVQFRYKFGLVVSARSLHAKVTKKGPPPFKFAPTGELGFVVGNTVSTNGASMVFFPTKAHHLAFPRVDLQEIKTGTSPSTALQIEQLVSTMSLSEADGLTLPEPSLLSYAPMTQQPPHSSVPPAATSDGIDFKDIITQDSCVDIQDPVDTPPLTQPEVVPDSLPGVAMDTSEQVTPVSTTVEVAPLVLTPSVPVSEGGTPSGVQEGVTESGVQEPSLDSLVPEDDTVSGDQEGARVDTPDPELSLEGPAGHTRSKRLFSAMASPSILPPLSALSDTPTVGKALKSPDADRWMKAIEVELQSLMDHGTGTEVPRHAIPASAQILPVKIVLKLKRDTTGVPTKFKARLCALGNLMRKSALNVFSPTANDKSLKLLMALSAHLQLTVVSIDVYGAFLYPTQTEEIYVAIPPLITDNQAIFWKLNKTMYGLPTSPAAFYHHVSKHLLTQGYTRCASDPCFFWLRRGDDVLLTVVHVDDFVVASSSEDMITAFIQALELQYVVTVSTDVQHFLGLHITEDSDHSRLLSQPGLLRKLFKKFPHIADLTVFPTVPMSSNFNDATQSAAPRCDSHDYMELLGSLMYLVRTRPDISYAVNRMAMRTQVATERDWNALLRILAYLFATPSLGIKLQATATPDAPLSLQVWCDASYATHSDGKSHSGYGFTFEGTESGLFYSRSNKQSNVTLSSTEAELYAAVEATKDTIWFRDLLAEIGFPQSEPTLIWVDNASLITLASEFSGNHKRVKHFLVRLNFLINQVDLKVIVFGKTPTELNIADGLTKPLGPTDFLPKRDSLMGVANI